jgi:hypothetical protein
MQMAGSLTGWKQDKSRQKQDEAATAAQQEQASMEQHRILAARPDKTNDRAAAHRLPHRAYDSTESPMPDCW